MSKKFQVSPECLVAIRELKRQRDEARMALRMALAELKKPTRVDFYARKVKP